MKKSKQWLNLQPLLGNISFKPKEAEKVGVSPRMLIYFYQEGLLEKIGRGIYRSSTFDGGDEPQWQDLAWAASSVPNGVICLVSALCYYDLTDQFMRRNWIAIPAKNRAPKRENTKIVRMRNITLGVEKISLCGYSVKIFDRERTVVDTFRLLDKETALKALKRYLTSSSAVQPNVPKLMRYAKKLSVNIEPYVMAFTL